MTSLITFKLNVSRTLPASDTALVVQDNKTACSVPTLSCSHTDKPHYLELLGKRKIVRFGGVRDNVADSK